MKVLAKQLTDELKKQLPEDWAVRLKKIVDIPPNIELVAESPTVRIEVNCRLGKSRSVPRAKIVAWAQRTAKQIEREATKLQQGKPIVIDVSDRLKQRVESGRKYRQREASGQIKL